MLRALWTEHETAVFYLSCGHTCPAPSASPLNEDREISPDWVECPTCGVPRRWLGYDACTHEAGAAQ